MPLLGIDFGTSTSRAALMSGGDVTMVAHAAGALEIPSVVAFPPAAAGGGPPLVGEAAEPVSSRQPERSISGVKRLLGRRLDAPEVRHHRQTVPYDLVGARNGDVRLRVGRRHHAPQDVAAYVMGALRAAAERQIGATVTDAVLAVPAMFNDLQRQAIRDAARIAGLNVLGVLTATSAAVLGSGIYPAPRGEERKTLVYDLGGGSFDVSALMVGDRSVEVLANGGDGFLGGDDFDQRIVAYLCDEVPKVGGGDLRRDRAMLARLKQVAERVKVELSASEQVDIHLPRPSGRIPFTLHFDRQRLETLTQDLVDRTVWACESVLRDAKWSIDEIDLMVVIGGQARMPRIREQLAEVCGKAAVEVSGSDFVVAMGAALHAGALAGLTRGRGRPRVPDPLTELTSLSLGLEAAGGVFTRLIPRGSALPAIRSQRLATSLDGQTQIVMHLLQGEREMAADNESVAQILIGPLQARPRGEVQLEVDITTDGGGLPTAAARIAETGEPKQVRVRPSAGLAESEIAALAAVHASGLVGSGSLLSELAPSELASSELASTELARTELVPTDRDHDSGAAEATDPLLLQGG